jgi:Aspartyl protease
MTKVVALDASRAALSWTPAAGAQAVRIESRVTHLGASGSGVLVTASNGRILRRIEAALPAVEWLNGDQGFVTDWRGISRPLRGGEREALEITAALLSGSWLAPDGRFVAAAGPSGELVLRLRDGLLQVTLHADPATGRPATAEIETLSGRERFELSYGSGSTPWVPVRVRQFLEAIEVLDHQVIAVRHGEAGELGFVEPPVSPPEDVRFDPVNRPVRLERAPGGQLLIEVEVNGFRGWFILDSGASITTVQSQGAVAAAPILGHNPVTSVWGVDRGAVRRADSIRVGPVVLADLPVIEMDHGFLADPLGRPIAGIIGYDLFSRVVVDVDPAMPQVTLLPDDRTVGELDWHHLLFEYKLPVIPGRWAGDHAGLFRLDLGAGSVPLIFHWPIVERLQLLEGNTGERFPAGSDTLVMGNVAWVEFAGERTDNVIVLLPDNPRSSPLRDVFTAGNVGLGLMGRFRIVFDYRRNRVAFAPLTP